MLPRRTPGVIACYRPLTLSWWDFFLNQRFGDVRRFARVSENSNLPFCSQKQHHRKNPNPTDRRSVHSPPGTDLPCAGFLLFVFVCFPNTVAHAPSLAPSRGMTFSRNGLTIRDSSTTLPTVGTSLKGTGGFDEGLAVSPPLLPTMLSLQLTLLKRAATLLPALIETTRMPTGADEVPQAHMSPMGDPHDTTASQTLLPQPCRPCLPTRWVGGAVPRGVSPS